MKKNLLFALLLVMSVVVFGQKLPFQGKLIESGNPVNDTRSFVFEIASVGWSESHADVTVTGGLYFVVLGSINPLPDSLFYGVDEQSLAISVNGTALLPVTLFKPLSSPFEGSELVVKNDYGTIVGNFYSRSDSLQSGELLLNGSNGLPNISLKGIGAGRNFGLLQLMDTMGVPKAHLGLADRGNAWFNLQGKEDGLILASMMDDADGKDLPFIGLRKQDRILATLRTAKYSGDSIGRGRLLLTNGLSNTVNMVPDGLQFYNENGQVIQIVNQNWGELGYSGHVDVRGPNSRNIEMSSKHWVNPDLPWFKMMGSQSQDVVQISVSEDSTESAYMNMYSNNNQEASLYTTGLRFNRGGENWREYASINVENRDDTGDAGYLNLDGPSSGNIHLGTRHWEGTSDLPRIVLSGENDFYAMEQSVIRDNENNQYGFVDLFSEDGVHLNIRPDNIGNDRFRIFAGDNDLDRTGHMHLYGPNSENIVMGGRHWEGTPDLPYMFLRGENNYIGLDFGLSKNENGTQQGYINLNSEEGKSLHLSPEGFGVENVGMNSQLSSDSMSYGYLYTRGPNTTNFETGGDWNNPDRAYLNLNGATDQNRIHMGIEEDNQQIEFGSLNITNSAQKEALVQPYLIRLNRNGENWREFASISVQDNYGIGEAGYFNLNGPNSANIWMGTRDWENSDLPQINMHGENDFQTMELSAYSDGNGYQEGFLSAKATNGRSLNVSPNSVLLHNQNSNQTIALETTDNGQGEYGTLRLNGPNTMNFEFMPTWWDQPDRVRFQLNGNTDEGRMNIGITEDNAGNEHGEIFIHSSDGIEGYLGAKGFMLHNNWQTLAVMGMNNDNGSWVGTLDVYGPSSSNVHIGSQQNPDLPWITLQGTDGFEAMQIGAVDDATQRGFIKMVNRESGEEMFYSSHGVGGNTPFQVSGGLSVDGFITLNGDTIHFGVSDRRYKKNIQSLGNDVLGKVELVRGVSYDWRKDQFPEKHFSNAKQIGVIAQELEAQFPELVKTNAEGYKSVNYDGLSAVLIEAVKELNAKVEKLEAENSQLKAELSASARNKTEIEQLKAQMESLVKLVQGQQSTALEETTSTSGLK